MKPDGGPAFPIADSRDKWMQGMSLRDWFAGMAVEGLMANSKWAAVETPWPEYAAKEAYEIADAMLKERDK